MGNFYSGLGEEEETEEFLAGGSALVASENPILSSSRTPADMTNRATESAAAIHNSSSRRGEARHREQLEFNLLFLKEFSDHLSLLGDNTEQRHNLSLRQRILVLQ